MLSFHPDRACGSDIRQLVESEEKFKLISRMKEKLLTTSWFLIANMPFFSISNFTDLSYWCCLKVNPLLMEKPLGFAQSGREIIILYIVCKFAHFRAEANFDYEVLLFLWVSHGGAWFLSRFGLCELLCFGLRKAEIVNSS